MPAMLLGTQQQDAQSRGRRCRLLEAHHHFPRYHAEKMMALNLKNNEPSVRDRRRLTTNRCNGAPTRQSPRFYSITIPGATKFFLPEGTTLVTMHVIIGGLFWLLSL